MPDSGHAKEAYTERGGTGVTNRRQAALKSWKTRRVRDAFAKARAAEAASKEALRIYCQKHGWRVAFDARRGEPRGMTAGIIFDAKLDGVGFQTEPLPYFPVSQGA